MRTEAGTKTERAEGVQRTVMRVLLALMAVVNLETGLWALIDPSGWYRRFPGFGHHWIDVQGAFDRHLIIDAGAGFFATGVVLAVAAIWMHRAAVTVALVALLAHTVPHFAYHVSHRVPGFSTFDTIAGAWGLALQASVALALLVYTWMTPRGVNR